jgi:hypothetical protein
VSGCLQLLAALDPGADAIAVELHFMLPGVTLRRALDQHGELELDKVGYRLERSWHVG